jgi:hypothetical protein
MLNKRAFYGDDWGVPSAEHPAGECLNRSAPGVEDGSYFEKAWVNDLMSLPGAIMNAAGYAPNGTEDTSTASQVFDALVNVRWSDIGNYSTGTIVTGSDGNQYYCNKANGRDSSVANPVGDLTDSWRQYPNKVIQGSGNNYAIVWYNGFKYQVVSNNIPSGTYNGIDLITPYSSAYRAIPVQSDSSTSEGDQIPNSIGSVVSNSSNLSRVLVGRSGTGLFNVQVHCFGF